MYANVSREEWVFRGLALAIVLAMVGMAMMPMSYGCKVGALLWKLWRPHNTVEAFRNGIISGVSGYIIKKSVQYILEEYVLESAIEGGEVGSIAGPIGTLAGIIGGAA